MKQICVQQFTQAPTAGRCIIDVRTPSEFEEIHIPGSQLEPLAFLDAGKVNRLAGGGMLYLVCRSGNRAVLAAEKLEKAGMDDVQVIEGGIQAWEAAGLPVVRGRRTISLERQVRIGAGAMVLFGLVLGMLVHPAFLGLTAFAGAGLLFAGLTDWCGMALLLARMPWNNRGFSSDRRQTSASQP